jgi:hypothetical protein
MGPPGSPDPLAWALPESPQAVKRGRKRKAAAVDPDEELGLTEATGQNVEAKKAEEFTEEEKQDMWLDFAAERYEIVEQLPLELHRNFRLLRDLDDGCICRSTSLGIR